MTNYQKKTLFQRLTMTIPQLSTYYMQKREYEFQNHIPLRGIKIRKRLHFLILAFVKLDRIIAKEKIVLLHDKRTKKSRRKNRPIIYAVAHNGGNDTMRIIETIKEPASLLFGDPGEFYKELPYLLLRLNGSICLETREKRDRHIAKKRAIQLLKRGGNLIIFPEGAWNISPNQLVMYLFPGTVSMARSAHALIVPVGIEQYEDTFYMNIGKEMDFNKIKGTDKEATQVLRDAMATLNWDIIKSQGVVKREEIQDNSVRHFEEQVMGRADFGYTLEDVYETRYHVKNLCITRYPYFML